MELRLKEITCGPCPYLEAREWKIERFSAMSFDPGIYEGLLAQGFRRSGLSFYRNICAGCGLCVPIRLDATAFIPSRTMKKLERLNSDLCLGLVDASFDEERFELYRAYSEARHNDGEDAKPSAESYSSFLLTSPFDSTKISEYRLPDKGLAATGYLDVLPGGLSSVYFAFDPALARRSIGTWSVVRELQLAHALGKRWYYLGFWVPGSKKMDYKSRFSPFEYAKDGNWHRAESREAAMAALGVA